MGKKSFDLWEVFGSAVAIGAVVWLSNSVLMDFRVTSTAKQKVLLQNFVHLDQLLKTDPSHKLITAETAKQLIQDERATASSLPFDFQWIQKKPADQQDRILRPWLKGERSDALERRIKAIEDQQVSPWTVIKAIVAWALATFFTPVISHLGKVAFRIQSKD